jgi:hypothetical protein
MVAVHVSGDDRVNGLEDREGQRASAGEIYWPDALAGLEVGIAQPGAQCFDEREQIAENDRQNSSHAHSNTSNNCLVQALLLKINDLYTNSTVVRSGSPPAGVCHDYSDQPPIAEAGLTPASVSKIEGRTPEFRSWGSTPAPGVAGRIHAASISGPRPISNLRTILRRRCFPRGRGKPRPGRARSLLSASEFGLNRVNRPPCSLFPFALAAGTRPRFRFSFEFWPFHHSPSPAAK